VSTTAAVIAATIVTIARGVQLAKQITAVAPVEVAIITLLPKPCLHHLVTAVPILALARRRAAVSTAAVPVVAAFTQILNGSVPAAFKSTLRRTAIAAVRIAVITLLA
jgi:hypothetical protein